MLFGAAPGLFEIPFLHGRPCPAHVNAVDTWVPPPCWSGAQQTLGGCHLNCLTALMFSCRFLGPVRRTSVPVFAECAPPQLRHSKCHGQRRRLSAIHRGGRALGPSSAGTPGFALRGARGRTGAHARQAASWLQKHDGLDHRPHVC